MARGILRYKSYSFRDKDPIIDAFRTLRQDAQMTFGAITSEGGPPPNTMHNWEYGDVKRPQFTTIWAAARTCGATGITSDEQGKPRFIRGNNGAHRRR